MGFWRFYSKKLKMAKLFWPLLGSKFFRHFVLASGEKTTSWPASGPWGGPLGLPLAKFGLESTALPEVLRTLKQKA